MDEDCINLVRRYAVTNEGQFVKLAIRRAKQLCKTLNDEILEGMINKYIPVECKHMRSILIDHLQDHEMIDCDRMSQDSVDIVVEVFIGYVVLSYLLIQDRIDRGMETSRLLVHKIKNMDIRILDPISCRIYFLYSLFYEKRGQLRNIREDLMKSYRSSRINGDSECEMTLINLILRNYTNLNHISLAEGFISSITIPTNADTCQMARFMYYLGRIKAIQLEYSTAQECLMNAMRKGPRDEVGAGFQQTVMKLSIIVQLLIGEIPDRGIFGRKVLSNALKPYFCIVKSIRNGNLMYFQNIISEHSFRFHEDKNFTLILRLRHNVIRTGIRLINSSYSRIGFQDIARKLGLDDAKDIEMIMAKTIKDRVISASIDSESGIVKSRDTVDVYNTTEPQEVLYQQIRLCNELYDGMIRSMRYPQARREWNKSKMSSKDARLNQTEDEIDGDDFQI